MVNPQYGPPIPPLAPAKFTGGTCIWLEADQSQSVPVLVASQNITSGFVKSVHTWSRHNNPVCWAICFGAAECPGQRSVRTTPRQWLRERNRSRGQQL